MVDAKCEKLTQEQFLDYGFDAVILENLKIDNGSKVTKKFYGETYLFASFSHYGHSLMDIYAQYKILKIKYKSIKAVMFENGKMGWLAKNSNISKDLSKMLNQTLDDVVDITKDNFYFEKVILFFDMNNTFPDEFYFNYGATRSLHYFPFCSCYLGTELCGQSKYFEYNYLAIDILKKDFITEYLSDKADNIYISRKRYNERYLEDKKYILSKNKLSLEDEEALHRIELRYYDNEDVVQSFFEKNGYTVIYPEQHSLFEQINIFSKAKSIVSISGTGLFNSFWCSPNTKIFELSAIPNYKYHYKEFAEYSGMDYKIINIANKKDQEIYDILLKEVL